MFVGIRAMDVPQRLTHGEVEMPESIAGQIARLRTLSTDELRQRYEEVYDMPARSRNKQWLFRRVAWGLQARIFGGLSPAAQARLEELAPTAELALQTPRSFLKECKVPLPSRPHPALRPGTALIKSYRGERHVVTMRDDGQLEWNGRIFRSLSGVANAISGSHVSGPEFFGLRTKK